MFMLHQGGEERGCFLFGVLGLPSMLVAPLLPPPLLSTLQFTKSSLPSSPRTTGTVPPLPKQHTRPPSLCPSPRLFLDPPQDSLYHPSSARFHPSSVPSITSSILTS